jgi:hypothetical protein
MPVGLGIQIGEYYSIFRIDQKEKHLKGGAPSSIYRTQNYSPFQTREAPPFPVIPFRPNSMAYGFRSEGSESYYLLNYRVKLYSIAVLKSTSPIELAPKIQFGSGERI